MPNKGSIEAIDMTYYRKVVNTTMRTSAEKRKKVDKKG